jgi:cytochrome c553
VGDYFGQCAELCGKEHAYMPIHVKVLSAENYAQWVDGKKKEAAAKADDPAKVWTLEDITKRGEKVYAANCAACHQPNGKGASPIKPLDGSAFITLVKTAGEFVRRSEQQLHAQLNQSVTVNGQDSRVTVLLRIVPDEDNPYAMLSAQDECGDALAEIKVSAAFKLNRQTAQTWVDTEFAKP